MSLPPQNLSPLLADALAASAQGRYKITIQLLEEAAQDASISGWAMFLMGAEYAALGQIDQAENAFIKAVLLMPSLEIARYQLGLLQFLSGRIAAAFLTWQPLLESAQSSFLQLWIQGFAALAEDDLITARGLFKAGIRFNEDNVPMSDDIQQILVEIDRRLAEPRGRDVRSECPQEFDEQSVHVLIANYKGEGTLH